MQSSKLLKNHHEEISDSLLVSQLRTIFAQELMENPEINTAWFLSRFIHARNHNMKEVEKMLSNYFAWRKKTEMKKVLSIDFNRWQSLKSIHEGGFYGVDKQGRPVIIERFMMTDIKRFLSPEFDDIREAYIISKYERMAHIIYPKASELAKKRIDNILIIYDLKGINFLKLFDSTFKKFVKFLVGLVQDNYPEMLGKLVIVNTTVSFKAIWAVVKLWLDKKTASKIEMHSGIPTERLTEFLDLDKMPEFLGGSCKTPIQAESGPWQPEYFQSIKDKTFFLKDRTLEYQYFYTEEERSKLPQSKREIYLEPKGDANYSTLEIRNLSTTLDKHVK